MSAITSSERTAGFAATFARCRSEGRAALIPYVTAGHPSRAETPDVLDMLEGAGADIIELGIPFSDPLADGPVIQRSSYESIRGGAALNWTLDVLASFRARSRLPVVVFTYLNPLLRFGSERFLSEAASAGADGVLLTDLPVGGDPELEARIDASALDRIRLVSPTTGPDRLATIADGARGFLYYVSRTGVTGVRTELADDLASEVSAVRRASSIPVAVGFGVSTPEHARTVARLADGVVVGSALVDRLGTGGIAAAGEYLRGLRRAVERTDDG